MRAHVWTRSGMYQSAIVLVCCVPGSSFPPPPYWKARRTWGRGCQLTTTWMCNIRLQAPTLARLWNFTLVALWCRRTDGYVTIKISLTDRYSYFLSCGAPLTRVELRYNLAVIAGGSEITAEPWDIVLATPCKKEPEGTGGKIVLNLVVNSLKEDTYSRMAC